jgi:uncharacterized cupredoxin-like copper-binding protein
MPFCKDEVRKPVVVGIRAICLVLCCALAGCGGALQNPASFAPQTLTLSGQVHGGQQPIAGATLQLYAAGQPASPTTGSATGGFGQGATALITPGSMTAGSSNNYWPYSSANVGATCVYSGNNVNQCAALPQTNANGNFSITGDYACPAANAQMYVVASGGNPGLSGTVNNQYIALMAALGSCNGLSGATYIAVTEVTTVAAVWSLQQFLAMPDGVHASSVYSSQGGGYGGVAVSVGASSGPVNGYGPDKVQSEQAGMANAFRMVNNLANNATGLATPVNYWATPTTSKINAIANTLASCVNTDGVSTNDCANLMSAATVNSLTPQDTLQAAYMMARNPLNNANALLGLATGMPPFAPFTPANSTNLDLTIEVGFAPTFTSGTSAGANAVYVANEAAIDENGHVWVYNTGGQTGITGAFVSEIDANGAALAGPFQTYTVNGGYSSSNTTACTTSTVHTLSNAPTQGMAIDQNGYLWVGNASEVVPSCDTSSSTRSVMRINTDTATVATGYWFGGQPFTLAVDGNNNVWSQASASHIVSFTGASSTYQASTVAYGSTDQASTVDMLGNVWFDAAKSCTAGGVAASAGTLYQVPVSSISATGSAMDAVANGFYTSGDTLCTGGTVATAAVQNQVTSLAADDVNGIWAANEGPAGTNTVTYFAPQSNAWTTAVSGSTTIPAGGALTSASGLGGLSNPYGVAVDGANHVWVANNNNGVLSELVASYNAATGNIAGISSLAGANGFVFGGSGNPYSDGGRQALIDGSGNVWIVNGGSGLGGGVNGGALNWLTVMVGVAAPVVTPLTFDVEYNIAPPVITGFSAAPTTINGGQSTTLTWTATGATTYTLSGVSGVVTSPLTVTPTGTTTYTLTATNLVGSATATVTVTVLPGINYFTASPTSVTPGQSSTLNWSVAGATSVTLTGVTGQATQPVVVTPSATTTYTLTASSASGTATATVTVGVQAGLPQISSFSASTISITAGQPVTFTWSTSGATSTTLSGVTAGAVSPVTVYPNASGDYQLTATNGVGSVSDNIWITVTAAASLDSGGSVTTGSPGLVVPSQFMGLGVGGTSFEAQLGEPSTGKNTILRQLINNLTAYGAAPITFKVTAVDTSSSTTAVIPSAAQIAAMSQLYTDVGATFFVGVDFADESVSTAVQQAADFASNMPAGSLIGMEIGNEVDNYTHTTEGYRTAPYYYLTDYANFEPSVLAALQTYQPSAKIVGPAWGLPPTLSGGSSNIVNNAGSPITINDYLTTEAGNLAFVTQHSYAEQCPSATVNTNSDYLLTPGAMNCVSSAYILAGVAPTHAKNLKYRLGETNSVAGGGVQGVSNTFSAALWALDWCSGLAAGGVDGVNFFGDSKNQWYTMFSFNTSTTTGTTVYSLNYILPQYYALVLFQQATQNSAAFLPVAYTAAGNQKAYAWKDAAGNIRVLILNKDESGAGTFSLSIPGYGAGTLTRLTAANLAATNGVTLAGQTLDTSVDGTFQGTAYGEVVTPASGNYSFAMPTVSAALLTIPHN